MCLTIKENLRSAIKVAEDDMTFYKAAIYYNGLKTPFKLFPIEIGKEYVIDGELKDVVCHDNEINESIFHLYKNYDDAVNSKYSVILKTTLKKGEKYIDGFFGDVPSVGVKSVNYSFATDSDENLYKVALFSGIEIIYSFFEGFAAVYLNGKYNFIDKEGKYLSEQWFDWIYNFFEGLARVQLNDKWNFIDKEGKYLSEQWFDFESPFSEGFAAVKLDSKWGKIDTKGNITFNKE